jgi:hypothetical protein
MKPLKLPVLYPAVPLVIPTLLLCVLAPFTLAQGPSAEKSAAPDRDRLIRLRMEGAVDIYNLDYAAAHAKFVEITKLYPDHPVGPLMLASTLWLQKLNEARTVRSPFMPKQMNDLTRKLWNSFVTG